MTSSSGERGAIATAHLVRESAHLPWRAWALQASGTGSVLVPVMTLAQRLVPPVRDWTDALAYGVMYGACMALVLVLFQWVRCAVTWSAPAYEVRDGMLRAQGSTGTDVATPTAEIRALRWAGPDAGVFGSGPMVPRLVVTVETVVAGAGSRREVEYPPLRLWGRAARAEALSGLRAACGLPAAEDGPAPGPVGRR